MKSIEEQIEAAWHALTEARGRRRYYLTDGGRLQHGDGIGIDVGTYTREIELRDFRDDVFFAFGRCSRGR
ncbi:MAG: hypothetical protein ABIR55_08860 [Burkholderiaceae bacterium]